MSQKIADERAQKQAVVFTEWVNYRLEKANQKPVKSLLRDLQDGTALYHLLETLSGKPVGKGLVAKPKNKMQSIGNLNLCFSFIASEKIRLENIGPEDIWDGTEVCVMGLIWTLILRYQISHGGASSDSEAKSALLEWVRQQVAPTGVPIENFTTTWADGRAFCALTSRFASTLEFPGDVTSDAVENLETAFRVNLEDLGVPSILNAADVAADPRGNEKSIMTYLALFKEMAELRGPKREVEVELTKTAGGVAYGAGLEGGKVGRGGKFTVEARDANGNRVTDGGDDCEVLITTPSGAELLSSIVDYGNGLYDITYAPNEPGEYSIVPMLNGTPINPVPFVVQIEPEFGVTDTSKSLAYGPGLTGGKVSRNAQFTIESVNSHGVRLPIGGDPWEVSITDPKGNAVQANIVDNNDGSYSVSYVPGVAGEYKIDVMLQGNPINGNPFISEIRDLTLDEMEVKGLEPSRSVAHGWGLRSGGLCVQLGKFIVYARDNRGCRLFVGGARCEVQVLNPAEKPLSTPITVVDNDDSTYSVVYRPEGPGWYTVHVKLNGEHVSLSPYRVLLHELNFSKLEALGLIFEPTDASKSIAYGKGLHGKQALDRSGKLKDLTATFTVQARDGNGQNILRGGDLCEIGIRGPGGKAVQAKVVDNFDGTYSVSYPVTEFGAYDIDVSLNGKPVTQSRKEYYCFVKVGEVVATGAGLTEAVLDESANFSLETKDVDGVTTPIGEDRLKVVITRPNGQTLPAEVSFNGDGTYDVAYEPRELGAHEIQVFVDGQLFGSYTSHAKASNIDPFNMRKGDDMPITAAKISVGLGWSNSGKGDGDIDLDASCMMFRYTTKLDHCYFKDTRSLCGSVTHSGDKRSGTGAVKDDETIRVNLDKVPLKYTTLLFTVNVWDQDKTFAYISNAYVRLVDESNGAELCRYSLNSFGARTGLIMCSVYRTLPSQWHMRAIGEFGDGRTIGHINKSVIRPLLMVAPPPQAYTVKILNARNLARVADAQGNQVYALIRFDSDAQKTRVEAGVDPVWNQAFTVQGQAHTIEVSLWQQRKGASSVHGFLGRVSITVTDPEAGVPIRWYILNNRGRNDGAITGKIRLGVMPFVWN